MARRKGFRKSKRKSKRTKRKSRRRKGKALKGYKNGFPRTMKVKLVYDGTIIQPATTGIKTHVWRGSSIFDPDFTLTGHQPYGFDTWATLYKLYKVQASKIEFTPQIDTELSGATPIAYSYTLGAYRDVGNIPTTMSQAREQRRAVHSFPVAGNQSKMLSMFRTSKQMMPNQWNNEDSTATMTADPAANWHWGIVGSTNSTVFTPVTWNVRITYWATLSNPITLAQS